ncbi:MAG: hypothetical protein AABY37_07190 [Actinomycetota bacterium]
MSETYEELVAELASTTKAWTRLSREYASRFISTVPLGNRDISLIPLADIKELANKVRAAREKKKKVFQQMNEFKRNHR